MDIVITRARRIFSDGRHNAFTGITRLGGRTFISFRSGVNHTVPRSAIKVIASSDLQQWNVVADVGRLADDIDNRDPKIVAFGGKLLLFYPEIRIVSRKDPAREPVGMVCVSEDGEHFSEPRPVRGLPGRVWVWCVREWQGRLYATGYDAQRRILAASDDGFEWEPLCDLPVEGGNECSFDFAPDGTLWALVREDEHGFIPTICTLRPPWREVEHRFRLPMRLQGPMLERLPGGSVIICRQWELPRRKQRTDVLWLGDGGGPQFVSTLPSGGDTSYAGWLDVALGRAVISYYSSHEHQMDVLPDHPGLKSDPAYAEHTTPADIFLADVAWKA